MRKIQIVLQVVLCRSGAKYPSLTTFSLVFFLNFLGFIRDVFTPSVSINEVTVDIWAFYCAILSCALLNMQHPLLQITKCLLTSLSYS